MTGRMDGWLSGGNGLISGRIDNNNNNNNIFVFLIIKLDRTQDDTTSMNG